MWPFKSKKQEADEIWRTLQGRPPADAMDQLVNSITKGDTKKAEDLFGQLMKEKIRKLTNENNRKS